MSLFSRLLDATSFGSPLLRTIAPSVAAAFALQTAAAIPSVALQTEHYYDLSGTLTYIAVGALSLCLPALRARALGLAVASPNWRQVVLTGAATIWAARLGSYLFQRVRSEGKDSRFDAIRHSPSKFATAFVGQAAWVSLCLMPILAVNSIPAAALSAALPRLLATDVLGLGLWVGGFAVEVVADRQKSRWVRARRAKEHDEAFMTRGLFGRSRFPNYFGEMTLWTGMAITAAGVLARRPVQLALGLSGGAAGILVTTSLAFVSPAFSALLLLKVSGVPMSEAKYDERYGHRGDYQEWKRNTPRLVPKLW